MARKKGKLGPAFFDEVNKVTGKFISKNKANDTDWKDLFLPNYDDTFKERLIKSPWATLPFILVCLILFFIIFLRLFHLQIVMGKSNRELADGNRIQIRIIHAPRGVIFDRNGRILASNSPAFRLYDDKINRVRLISREEALELEVKNDPRVLNLEVDNVRNYPLGEKFAHVVGYVGEISENQLKDREFKGLRLGDRIGQFGIEAQYEKLLRGIDGGEIIEVDSKGVKIRALRRISPIPGQNIYLTIDSNLQENIYDNLKKTLVKTNSCCASAVSVDPKNGQVLTLVSLPSFNPNIFTTEYDERAITNIFTDSTSPLLNRAISGTYPPASTYKIVSSLAALRSGKITKETIVQDNGIIYLGSFSFANWYFTQYGKTEGSVNILKALQRSNDIYFYTVGQIIGEKVIGEWSRKLYLGKKLGIDLSSEAEGLVPDDEWKRKTLGEGWYPGDSLHMAIGQGFVLTTPLQVLGYTAFIAGNGILYQPQLMLTNFQSKILIQNIAPASDIEVIKQGLALVPNIGGTAWPFFTFPIKTAGKTGTAEFGDPNRRTHAWYTSYAPADDPKIVLTVILEGAGEGSSIAAPIVKEAYRFFFSEDKNKLIQDVYTQATDSGRELGE